MSRRPPRSIRTYTLFPDTTRVRTRGGSPGRRVLVDAAGDRLGAWMHVWRVLVPRTSAGPAVGGVDARLAGIGAPNVGRSRGWGRGCTCGGYWCTERRPVPRLGAWLHDWRALVSHTYAGPAVGGRDR